MYFFFSSPTLQRIGPVVEENGLLGVIGANRSVRNLNSSILETVGLCAIALELVETEKHP